jgi:LuxR family maltose regulon positive regulatory protein
VRVSTAAERPSAPLISTKIDAPLRRDLVSRRALLDLLRRRPLPRLTLVRAPAGWGKSTLLADWCASEDGGRLFAWLALDRFDNDPVRFWRYVVGALQTVAADVGATTLGILSVPGRDVVEEALPPLINDLTALQAETILVLDDYHLVRNEEIHEGVAFVVERLPREVRLVIGTRSEPSLPLGRLRARGDLLEIDSGALSFSNAETRALLNDVHGLALSEADVTRLQQRTEGWPAGLYLAALSLRGRADPVAFIDAFSGDDRHVVDYLSAEVLAGESAEMRDFLLRTSILERLSGPLCDAVTGRSGSAQALDRIVRSNVFLIPLDSRREWYRYHHLFAELLRHELALVDPELAPTLHRRAADWYRERGPAGLAIHHAVAAGMTDEAADLVATHWNGFLNRGRLATVVGWLDALPPGTVAGDPRLCLARAGTSLTLGRYDDVDRWLDEAEHGARGAGRRAGAASVEAEAAIYRAVRAYRVGELARAAAEARRAVSLERDDRSPWRAMAYAALGRSLYWTGEASASRGALELAVRLHEPGQNTLAVLGALGYLAVSHAAGGRLAEAEAAVDSAVALSEEHGFTEHWVTVMALAAQASVRAERSDAAGAVEAATRAVELGHHGAAPLELAYCQLVLAEAARGAGDAGTAATALAEARATAAGCRERGVLAGMLRAAAREAGERASAAGARPSGGLTERELAILRLLPTRLSQREIGRELYVSLNTVKTHTRAIFRKLDVSSRADAVVRARELGLL